MTAFTDDTVHVRYLVDDVQAAIDFYTTHLGFTPNTAFLPAFADVLRGQSAAAAVRAGQLGGPGPAGRRARPQPGGWNRIHLLVDDIDAEVARLRAAGVGVPQRHRHRPWRAGRSSSTTRPATRSSCSSPQAAE